MDSAKRWCREGRLALRLCIPARLILLAVVLHLVFCFTSVADAAATAPDWTIDCADCPPYFADVSPRSLQFDGNDILHIVYGAEHLYHAWNEAGKWRSEMVDSTLDVGHPAVLAVDGLDNLHVIYYGRGDRTLRYAHRTNEGWQLEEVVDDLTLAEFPAAAVDGLGRAHVAYFDAGSDQLTYAYRAGGGWRFEPIEQNGIGRGVSLAVDADGVPHVSYGCEGTCYAVRDETGWRSEIVVSGDIVPPPVGEFDLHYLTSLTLDDDGHPHIVFAGGGYEFTYATREDNGWVLESVSAENWWYSLGGSYYTLALDEDGEAHVSYAAQMYPPKGGLYFGAFYATRGDGGWAIEHIGEKALPTLALNGLGEPHIEYVSEMILYDVVKQGLAWQTDIILSGGDAGGQATLALDPLGDPRVVSLDEISGIVRQAVGDGDEWHTERMISLFSGIPIRAAIAYTLDESGVEHLFALLNTGISHEWDPVGYAFRDDSGWQSSLFWPIDVRGFYAGPSMALDGMGMPHVSIGRQTWDAERSLLYGGLDQSGDLAF